ncbi:MAG TPA: hypothetical protein VM261_00145 [Kofleriaceae bacterium]|nr:hypothetical protein [Kofleriaceae bacterium]
MGRSEDARPLPQITGATPREVYFEALGLWRKADRLASEVGGAVRASPPSAPGLTEIVPGHVLAVIDATLARLDDAKVRIGLGASVPEPSIEDERQPADVLVTLMKTSRELSRALERPFTPSDVFEQVSLALAYATRIAQARGVWSPSPAAYERRRRPADCYERLEVCLSLAGATIERAGHRSLHERGTPSEVQPGDVFDLACLVVGELAFLHAITPGAVPVHAFEPAWHGHRLPAHVDQLARTLESQLESLQA